MASVIPMVMGASGNPERMQPGDAAALGSGGTGATTATAAAQNLLQAWEKISDATYSSAAAAPFTGLSGYRMIRGYGRLIPATNSVVLGLRLSSNNGSSYDSTSSRYTWTYNYSAEGLTGQIASSTDSTRFYFFSTISSTDGCWFNFVLSDFNQAAICGINWQFNGRRASTSNAQQGNGGGWYNQTTARDAFQIAFSSGNIASGHIVVEGLI